MKKPKSAPTISKVKSITKAAKPQTILGKAATKPKGR
jgi:hypothetical protein